MCELKKLKYVIEASLKDNSLVKLQNYLSSLKVSQDFLNGGCVLLLTEVLKMSEKHEEKTMHIYCVLSCLHHFLNTISDTKKWIEVSEDLSKLCDNLFLLSSCFIREDSVVEKVVNVISELAEKVDKIADNMMKFTFRTMVESSLSTKLSQPVRLLIMNLTGTLLQNASRRIRYETLPSTMDLLNELSSYLVKCDDYETQVSVTEILARSQIFLDLKHKYKIFTKNEQIGKIFKKYLPFLNFDSDCRLFLNEINESLGVQQKVFSLPCMMIFADKNRLSKPIGTSDFWVDFNLGSRSVSFCYQPGNSDFGELLTLPQDIVISAVAKESACQSRNGERFEAVKLKLIMDPSNLSPEWEIPKQVKIYFRRDEFIKTKFVVQMIFDGKYEIPDNVIKECIKDSDKTKGSSSFFGVKTLDGLPYTSCKKGMLDKTSSQGKVAKENEIILQDSNTTEEKTFLKNVIMPKGKKIKKLQVGDRFCGKQSYNFSHSKENVDVDKSEDADSRNKNAKTNFLSVNARIKKTPNQPKKEDTFVFNTNLKKKHLYYLEKSNAEDMKSFQDQVLSIEVPSYNAKKESLMNSQVNIKKKNIGHVKQEKSATYTHHKMLKPFNCEELEEFDVLPLNDGDSENEDVLSLNICKDTKPKSTSEDGTKGIIFLKKPQKYSEISNTVGNPKKQYDFLQNCTYSAFNSPQKRKVLTYNNKYGRNKLKPCINNRVIGIESSHSGSKLVPFKLMKKYNEENKELTLKESIPKKKIDPLGNNIVSNNMNLDREYNDEKLKLQPKKIAAKSLMNWRRGKRKIQGTTMKDKNVIACKKKKTKHVAPILTINSKIMKCRSEIAKEYIIEKISKDLTGRLDLVQYDDPCSRPTFACEDLALDFLNFNDQKKALLLNSTFKVSDLIRFGNILMKQIQDKVLLAEKIAIKERENGLSTFDYKIQASSSGLCGSFQETETVTEKFEKLNTMLQATYKLHKEITTEINLGFFGYLKKIVLSFIQGITNKSAIQLEPKSMNSGIYRTL